MLCFQRLLKQARENDCFLTIMEETEIHKENTMFPRALQSVNVATAHSLMAGATGLSHLIPDRKRPVTGR